MSLLEDIPYTMNRNELIQALEASPLVQAASAALALHEGWKVEAWPPTSELNEGLAATYSVRLEHLRSKTSAHAHQLAVSTEEFVINLRKHAEAYGIWFSVTVEAEYEFAICCEAVSGEPLGCLRTVSQLKVSAERWRELWAGA
jgi:hypothetical protein